MELMVGTMGRVRRNGGMEGMMMVGDLVVRRISRRLSHWSVRGDWKSLVNVLHLH